MNPKLFVFIFALLALIVTPDWLFPEQSDPNQTRPPPRCTDCD